MKDQESDCEFQVTLVAIKYDSHRGIGPFRFVDASDPKNTNAAFKIAGCGHEGGFMLITEDMVNCGIFRPDWLTHNNGKISWTGKNHITHWTILPYQVNRKFKVAGLDKTFFSRVPTEFMRTAYDWKGWVRSGDY